MSNKYLVKPSTIEDSLENWVWINDITKNDFIKILNTKSKKSVIVYKRTIDDNFINFYNSKKTVNITDLGLPTIVINEYYRNVLSIEKNCLYELEIRKASFFEKFFNSNWTHPNPTVSLSYKLSIVSLIFGVLLSIVSIILGVLSLK